MIAKITVTRALAELKLLQKRINNGIQDLAVIGYQQSGKMQSPYNYMEIGAFQDKAKASLTSVEDLIARITLVKTAIDKSNTTTIVKIGKKEMTIQEALVEKNLIDYKRTLLSKMKSQLNETNRKFEQCTERVDHDIDELRKQLGTSKDVDVDDICKKTLELKYPKMVDPCDLAKKIESLTEEIEDFENNVDYALSESNSVTYIEV